MGSPPTPPPPLAVRYPAGNRTQQIKRGVKTETLEAINLFRRFGAMRWEERKRGGRGKALEV